MRPKDKFATDTLFKETYRKVRAYAKSLCRNASMADDITQETLLRAYMSLDTFDTRASFDTWVLTIARNQYIDSLRKANRRVQMVSPDTLGVSSFMESFADEKDNPEQALLQSNIDPLLAEAINQLSLADQKLLHWVAVEDVSIAEAARRLETTPRRIRTRYRDLLNRVRLYVKLSQKNEPDMALVYTPALAV